jgi:hypothetical protein
MMENCKKISLGQTAPKEQREIVDHAKLILSHFNNIICFGKLL